MRKNEDLEPFTTTLRISKEVREALRLLMMADLKAGAQSTSASKITRLAILAAAARIKEKP